MFYYLDQLMKKNQGNIIILFVLILLIIIIFSFLSLKAKIEHAWTPPTNRDNHSLPPKRNEQQTSTPPLKETELSTSSTESKQESKFYEYYNDLSVIQDNEITNPFLSKFNEQNQASNLKEHVQINSNEVVKTKVSISNILKKAPNGFDFPNKTGLLTGYPALNSKGKLNISISNKLGHSNLAVFLYLIKPFNDQSMIDLNELLTGIYLKAGDEFSFAKVQSGYYRIVWVNLANKKTYRSKEFAVFQDNKYAYDRVFTFYPNNTSIKNKATEISIYALYK